MCHRLFSQLATTCFIVIAFGATVADAGLMTLNPGDSSTSVTLADLMNGTSDGVLVGDKEFTEFFYASLPDDDMPAAEDINVFGFQDVSGNYGVSFHGAFLDLPGGGASDALIRFTVDVTDDAYNQGWRISDAHLFIGGVGVGDNSFFTVDETFEGLSGNTTLNTYATTLAGNVKTQLADWIDFDSTYRSLRVTKDILALSGDPNQPARATVIDQSFSQIQVPEPATIGLVALALLGMVAIKREN